MISQATGSSLRDWNRNHIITEYAEGIMCDQIRTYITVEDPGDPVANNGTK